MCPQPAKSRNEGGTCDDGIFTPLESVSYAGRRGSFGLVVTSEPPFIPSNGSLRNAVPLPVHAPAMSSIPPFWNRWRWPLISIQALVPLLGIMALAMWLVERPRRVIEEFAGHVKRENYSAAAQLLEAPSLIRVAAQGDLIVVDCQGNETTVPQSLLPFIVGGGAEDGGNNFSMTALLGSRDGVLPAPPAVVLHLRYAGGRVRIQRVGP